MAQPEKRNLVIFLGAGFSAAFGIPVMRAFSDKLRDLKILNAREQRDFDNIQLTCDGMGALIGSSSRNLEQLSSFLAVQQINNPTFEYPGNELYKTPAQALRLVKRCIFELVRPNLGPSEVSQNMQFFEPDLHSQFNVSFVTTNYDLVLEMSGVQRKRKVNPSHKVLDACSNRTGLSIYSPHDQPPHLFKLHGSVNWFKKESDNPFVLSADQESIPDNCLSLIEWTASSSAPYESTDCLIVPPSVIKPQIDDLLGEQWRGATEAIHNADAVWFIGYSFPESDSFMRYFVASAFARNTKIRQLTIIDPDVAVKKRALGIFRAERLREVFSFIPLQWQIVDYGHLMKGDVERAAANLKLDKLDMITRKRSILWPND